MKFINSQEIKYILFATLFSFIFFVIIIPNILPSVDSINPYIQFIIFNIAIFIFLQLFLKSVSIGKKVKIIYSIGIVLLFVAIDIMIPPLLVNTDGTFSTAINLGQSSSDYIFALIWQSVGISGFLLYVFTYVITPLILLIISALILKNLVEEL